MDRRPLHILMAFVLAFQASLVGMAVCSDGGCCHDDEVAAHVDGEEGEHHEHSTLVSSNDAHPCNCTDQEIAGDDALAGSRDDLSDDGPSVNVAIATGDDSIHVRPSVAPNVPPWLRRGDPGAIQRIAMIRSTRLLL